MQESNKVQREFTKTSSRRNVRAIVFPIAKQDKTPTSPVEPGKSKVLDQDPIEGLLEKGDIIEPPFDLLTLAMLPEHNSELVQCVEAMEINIEGFGHRFIPRYKEPSDKEKKAMKEEKIRLENFFSYATVPESFTAFRRKIRNDLETTGNAYFEVLRNTRGEIDGFNHVPSYMMHLGRVEENSIKTEMPILKMVLNKEGDYEVVLDTKIIYKRFRKYVQTRWTQRRNLTYAGTHRLRWFKEFGDTRNYSNKTGNLVDDTEALRIGPDNLANEMVHFRLYSPRTPYGIPRFVGNLLSIFGDRASEEINYITFKNNNIPSMLLLVSNGQLTQGSINRIKDFVETQIQGQDNYSKFLLLEAEPPEADGEDLGQVKLEVKPLTQEQHKDALFQNYSKNNQDKIRRSFRLPPIFVGRSDEYTRATAESSRRLADEQIFAPERNEFDNWMNRIMLPAMSVRYYKYKSNSPNTTDNAELVKILAGAEKTGGMTPRIARMMLEDILGIELPEFPDDFDPDVPFSLLMAEAVKNKADPTEPGQQVTALKMLEVIEKITGADISQDQDLLERLEKMKDRLEKRWVEDVGFEVDEDHDHDHGNPFYKQLNEG